MKSRKTGVNDILLKFVDEEVFDIRKNPKTSKKYIHERDQFEHYIQNKKDLQTRNVMQAHNYMNPSSSTGRATQTNYINPAHLQDLTETEQKQIKLREEKDNEGRCIEIRERFINIDSKDRDLDMWPNQNNYIIDVSQEAYTNVWKIEIVASTFININQLIYDTPFTVKNNFISWNIEEDEAGGQYVVYTAEIDEGNYTPAQLATEIENKMNAVPRVNGLENHFDVFIDVQNDEVIFSSYEFTTYDNPLTTVIGEFEIQVTTPLLQPHGLSVGQEISVEDCQSVGGIPASTINQIHVVTDVIDANNYKFEVTVQATINEANVGGPFCKIGAGVSFRLLFSFPYSPAKVLGFPEEDTGFAITHHNSDEFFPYPGETRLSINYMLPGPYIGTTIIRTTLPHLIEDGTRIYIYDIAPPFTTIIPYNHEYGQVANTTDDEEIRDTFVGRITATEGLVTVLIDEYTLLVEVPYGDYETTSLEMISDYITNNVSDNDEFGNLVLRKNEVDLDFFGNQYFLMNSTVLAENFSCTNHNVNNKVFAKIQLAGDPYDTILNSYVGGQKVFYNNTLDTLNEIDFRFCYCDGTKVDFIDTDHSFVLKITEVIQKVQRANFNSKIGK